MVAVDPSADLAGVEAFLARSGRQSPVDRGIRNPILAAKLILLGEYVDFRCGQIRIKSADRLTKKDGRISEGVIRS